MRNVDLTSAAEEDLTQIWLYTFEKWGINQAETYYDQLVTCCIAIGNKEAFSKHVEGLRHNVAVHRCQHHYIFFEPKERPMILAILHGRMDFMARLSERL